MSTFESFNLPKPLLESLQQLNFTTPTPIQELAIPKALLGQDILGSAQTGTGKTAAFGIPLITKLLLNPSSAALVLTPTRELALQVMKMLKSLLAKSKINTALLIGGEPIFKQFRELKARPRLIVATPGRLNDHLERRSVRLNQVDFLVLDETDRMLDMGFSIQIDEIVKHLPQQRQTLLFSATLPSNIIKMAERYMNSPERVAAGNTTAPAAGIKQEMVRVNEEHKYAKLLEELERREGTVIVFVKTKHGAERMAELLRKEELSADAIHGDLRQRQRERVIRSFRDRKYRIMVATDIAARGLDISHVKHVINYDLPQCPEDYIHRIGRTARAGAEGCAISFVTHSEQYKWKAIDRMMNPDAYKSNKAASKSDEGKKRWRSGAGPKSRFGQDKGPRSFFKDKNDEQGKRGFSSFKKDRSDEQGNRAFSSFKKERSDEQGNRAFSSFKKDRNGESGNRAFSSFKKDRGDEQGKRGFSSFNKDRNTESGNRAFSSFKKDRSAESGNKTFGSFKKKRFKD